MIRLPRWLRRTPPPPPAPAIADIAVIDGTGSDLGDRVLEALVAQGDRATLVSPNDLLAPARTTVVLLPARARMLPDTAAHFLSVAEAIVQNTGVTFPGRITLAWCLPDHERTRFSVPRPVTRNWSPLLLGTAWSRELAHHQGDQRAATECYSSSVAQLMLEHGSIAGVRTADLYRTILTLDPNALHTLTIRTKTPEPDLRPICAATQTQIADAEARTPVL
ncbi:hypothetical protein Acsp05_44180 [Actinokineospora sp. NBRC 105648]|nr:hypothetical protein Acsp05_44180 [Actinokineospora sp. NBRC 105648]